MDGGVEFGDLLGEVVLGGFGGLELCCELLHLHLAALQIILQLHLPLTQLLIPLLHLHLLLLVFRQFLRIAITTLLELLIYGIKSEMHILQGLV